MEDISFPCFDGAWLALELDDTARVQLREVPALHTHHPLYFCSRSRSPVDREKVD